MPNLAVTSSLIRGCPLHRVLPKNVIRFFFSVFIHFRTVKLTLTEQGPALLAYRFVRQRRDALRRVDRSAVDAEKLFVKGRELEMRLRPFEFSQSVHVQQRNLPELWDFREDRVAHRHVALYGRHVVTIQFRPERPDHRL